MLRGFLSRINLLPESGSVRSVNCSSFQRNVARIAAIGVLPFLSAWSPLSDYRLFRSATTILSPVVTRIWRAPSRVNVTG